MFVSPPPTYLIKEGSSRKISKGTTNDDNSLQQQQQFHLPSITRKETNFVSAPPEYADRARIEIRKRLLQQGSSTSRHNRVESTSENSSIYSSDSLNRVQTENTVDSSSIFSDNASSYQSSIFSHPNTVITHQTADSGSIIHTAKFVTHLTLEEALPSIFYDMYSPELLTSDPSKVLYNGRPSFTKRELLDWDLNDIRSLLIIEVLRPEWGNRLPEIITNGINLPKFKSILLPLHSSDDFIINTLVNSDLYIEANLDYEFKLTSAKYTVTQARKRHEQITGLNEPLMNLSKPEWRNIIENYLLNIAVEAQCRFDFKQQCSEFKKWKIQQTNTKKPNMPPPSVIPLSKLETNSSKSLLKKALMKNMEIKNNDNILTNSDISQKQNSLNGIKISLTKEEKANIWSHCQAQVYYRLGLDWKPDGVR